jgi:hypothetical protein
MKGAAGFGALLAVLLAAGPALADGIVVNGFSGAKKQLVRDRLAAALEQRGNTVIAEKSARVAPESKTSVYVSAAKKHEVTAFVDGEVTMKDDGWALEMTVRNGADGEIIGASTLRAPWLPKLLTKIDKEAGKLLEPVFADAKAPGGKKGAVAAAVVDLDDEDGDGKSAKAKKNKKGKGKPEKSDEEPKGAAAAEEEPKRKEAAKAGSEDEAEGREADPEEAKEAEPEAKDEPHDRGASDDARRGKKLHGLELGVGFGVFSRALEYNQDVNRRFHEYHLPLAPVAAVEGRFYPASYFTDGIAARFGLAARFERSAGLSSKEDEGGGPTFGTKMQEYAVGVRYRQPLRPVELGGSLSYGSHEFSLDGDAEPGLIAANGMPVARDRVPDISYQYLRPAIDVRLTAGRIFVGAGLGYRLVVGTGEVGSADWFPHSSAAGIDASLTGGYEVVPGLAVTASGDFRRYAFDMNAEESDLTEPRDVAGGAVDQYLGGRIGVEWRPGTAGADSTRWNAASGEPRHVE